jgi:hypothetical protein
LSSVDLPAPLWPNQRHDLTRHDLDAHAVQHLLLSIAADEALHFQEAPEADELPRRKRTGYQQGKYFNIAASGGE